MDCCGLRNIWEGQQRTTVLLEKNQTATFLRVSNTFDVMISFALSLPLKIIMYRVSCQHAVANIANKCGNVGIKCVVLFVAPEDNYQKWIYRNGTQWELTERVAWRYKFLSKYKSVIIRREQWLRWRKTYFVVKSQLLKSILWICVIENKSPSLWFLEVFRGYRRKVEFK